MKDIHILNIHICSPLLCARGCDEGQDIASSQARCPLVWLGMRRLPRRVCTQ